MTLPIAMQPDHWQRLILAEDEQEFLQSWLACLMSLCGRVTHAAVVWCDAPNVGPFHLHACFPLGVPPERALADLCERVLELRVLLIQTEPQAFVVCPVLLDSNLYGVVALGFDGAMPAHASDVLQWGMGWLRERIAGSESRTADVLRERLFVLLDALTHVIDASKAVAAAQAVVTELAQHMGCERVSVGLSKTGGIRLTALSHSADFSRRNDLTLAIECAMNEAVDQGETIFTFTDTPAQEDDPSILRVEQTRLSKEFDSDAVLTVPFCASHHSCVFVFEWVDAQKGLDWRDFATSLVPLLGRALLDRSQQDQFWHQRSLTFIGSELRKLLGPRYGARKLIAVLVAIGVVFLVFARGDFLVAAHSELEGRVRRVIASPFEGFVASSISRAGHVVKAGDVLATLDDRDLRLETLRWESQQTQYIKQSNEAQAQHNLAQLQISMAQTRQAEAQRELSETMVDRSQIRAPFDGVIVLGDLSQNLGGAVKKGQTLFEIAPLDSYRVVLHVDETDIPHIKAGQQGQLMLAALAGVHYPFTVTLVTPVAQAKEGKNTFRVEATLDARSTLLRPGMEGIAKINAGQERLLWIWTHRFIDWMRLQSWAWLGL